MSGSVSKKTTYLLAGEEAGSKLEKAEGTVNVKVISEEEFRAMIKALLRGGLRLDSIIFSACFAEFYI